MKIKNPLKTYTAPFRVGRKTRRAILDSKGNTVMVFPEGMEFYASEYCDFLNENHTTIQFTIPKLIL